MSKEAQIEHQPGQQDAAAQTTELNEETLGLPGPLYAQIVRLTPNDAEALSSMLTTYQRLSGAILQVAARRMGNAAVQRAIAIATHAPSASGPGETRETGAAEVQPGGRLSKDEMRGFLEDSPAKAQPAKGPLSHDEMRGFLEDPPARAQPAKGRLSKDEMRGFLEDPPARTQPAKSPLSQDEMRGFLEDSPAKAIPTAPAAAQSPAHATAEPAWVGGARAYNEAHGDLVDEFNELTSDVCRLDGEGKVDPQAVSRWQTHHGLAADGKIGPHTVAAARKLKAKAPEVAAVPHADARPPV
jgi:hypothetical protein